MSTLVERKRKWQESIGKTKSGNKKKRAKSIEYHSSSEDEGTGTEPFINHTNLQIDDKESKIHTANEKSHNETSQSDLPEPTEEESEEAEENDEYGSEELNSTEGGSDSDDADSNAPRKTTKRNDPQAFATSIAKILSSKLTTSKRADPVLSRSKDASLAAKEISENRLEAKAKRKLRDEKRLAREKGRERDVLGVQRGEAGEAAELEKTLRKTAQRGVVKLFNAVRAAQIKAEEMERIARNQGTVGLDRRKEKVNEMSKKGFLDLLVEGGKN